MLDVITCENCACCREAPDFPKRQKSFWKKAAHARKKLDAAGKKEDAVKAATKKSEKKGSNWHGLIMRNLADR